MHNLQISLFAYTPLSLHVAMSNVWYLNKNLDNNPLLLHISSDEIRLKFEILTTRFRTL